MSLPIEKPSYNSAGTSPQEVIHDSAPLTDHSNDPYTGSSRKSQKKEAESGDSEGRDNSSSSSSTDEVQKAKEPTKKSILTLPASLKWIPANWTWSSLKPVIRTAVAAWISLILFIIPKVEITMGQASFLILIASFFSPPSDPFISVLEREFLILLSVTIAWAWTCLGMKLADLARTNRDPSATLASVVSGQYIEAAPTVIAAIFVFIGSSFFLYIKARQGPGPFLFASIFACICIDISMTTSVLFPFPFYKIGQAIFIPLSLHSAVALLTSILIFPTTISAQYTTRLQAVYAPLRISITQHIDVLKTPTSDPAFSHAPITISVGQAEGALIPLAASARLMNFDIIYCRFAPTDFINLHNLTRRLAGRANGMEAYFGLIDPTRERFPVTPAPSRPASPMLSPRQSRTHSLERGEREHGAETERFSAVPTVMVAPVASNSSGNRSSPSIAHRRHPHYVDTSPRSHHMHPFHSRSHVLAHTRSHTHSHNNSHHHILHSTLLNLALSRSPPSEQPVGVFESQRYITIEATHLSATGAALYTARATVLLRESCEELLGACGGTLGDTHDWLSSLRNNRIEHMFERKEKKEGERKERIAKYDKMRTELLDVLERFRNDKRLRVLDPYRRAFDPKYSPHETFSGDDVPPHRFLFHCYVYQYHLLQFSNLLVEVLEEIIRLETERQDSKLWTPLAPLGEISWRTIWKTSENLENLERDDDENPEVVQGLQPEWLPDLGLPRRRDPDAMPPQNLFEYVMNAFHEAFTGLGGGNALFALKAGTLTILLCLPSFLKSTAHFAYANRFVWAIFMGQLTIARFRGDTTFGLVARVMSTFLGGVVGMVMWYISCGSGRGNPYGLAAVCAVCFPIFFYAVLYYPGPPMTKLIFFVTTMLVVGYSYQDVHIILPSSPGFGVGVAWRRFVLVTAGVTAAFLFSFLPPSTTIRRYQRMTLATTASEIATVYCSVLSFANSQRTEEDTQGIIRTLLAVRSKLKRSILLRQNVVYEFSLRGKWPAARYHKILDIQLQVSYTLTHLMSVIEHLEPAWTLAFLRRTRFLDSDFQGDVLAVISMIATALRDGTPLPQITPCPLVDRFLVRHHGLNVVQEEAEEDFGLPRTVTMGILEDEQYLMFCVGVSSAYALVNRLDRLMVAVKELVGEQYHIHGVGLKHTRGWVGVELGSRTNSIVRPPQDV